jgi:hypothetical protein
MNIAPFPFFLGVLGFILSRAISHVLIPWDGRVFLVLARGKFLN